MPSHNAVIHPPAPALPAVSLERPIRRLLWPRQRSLSLALSGALIAALAFPTLLGVRDADRGASVVAVAVLLAAAGRMAFELPPRTSGAQGPRMWLAVAVRSASAVVVAGSLLAALSGHPLTPWAAVASWSAMTVLFVVAATLRRAEVAYRTGTRLFVLGSADQARDLRCETVVHGDLDIVEQHDPTAPATAERLLANLQAARATILVLSERALRSPEIVRVAIRANLAGIRVRDLRSFYEQEFGKVATSELTLTWFLFDIAAIHRRRFYGTTKRVAELLVAGGLLLATAPLFPPIALAIKFASPGPVLFRQPRVGGR